MTVARRISLLLMLVSLFGLCKPDPACTNASNERGENRERTTKKTGDANIHLSPWNVNVWRPHAIVTWDEGRFEIP
jgi:hypothetical protein